MDPDADEPLLGAVVEIALDPLPLGVDGVERPDAGPPQVPLEREALETQPEEAGDRQREGQELERRLVENGEERQRERDEDDRADDEEPPERAQRSAPGDERQGKRKGVTLVGVGAAADEHAFLPGRDQDLRGGEAV